MEEGEDPEEFLFGIVASPVKSKSASQSSAAAASNDQEEVESSKETEDVMDEETMNDFVVKDEDISGDVSVVAPKEMKVEEVNNHFYKERR